MRVAAYRPRRKIRSEILQLSIAMVIPAIVFDAFPYKALRPVADSAAKDEARPATCAFVSLSPDDERRILAVARSAWHVDAESVRSLRLEMFVDEIPDVALPPVADISVRKRNVRNLQSRFAAHRHARGGAWRAGRQSAGYGGFGCVHA